MCDLVLIGDLMTSSVVHDQSFHVQHLMQSLQASEFTVQQALDYALLSQDVRRPCATRQNHYRTVYLRVCDHK